MLLNIAFGSIFLFLATQSTIRDTLKNYLMEHFSEPIHYSPTIVFRKIFWRKIRCENSKSQRIISGLKYLPDGIYGCPINQNFFWFLSQIIYHKNWNLLKVPNGLIVLSLMQGADVRCFNWASIYCKILAHELKVSGIIQFSNHSENCFSHCGFSVTVQPTQK